jgi:hypothetical protein
VGRDLDGADGLTWDGEFADLPFLARAEQARLGVWEGSMAVVEAGPILRVVWDLGFRIWFESVECRGSRGEKDFGYCGLL